MNSAERVVYRALRRFPQAKMYLRNVYQAFFDLVPGVPIVSASPVIGRSGFFFGFHDHSPFSPDGRFLAANRILIKTKMPRPGDELEVGYFDGETYLDYHPVARTRAWNWQMGCKLQWVGWQPTLMFNDLQDGQPVARAVDVVTGAEKVYNAPLASVAPNGEVAVGYDFLWVERCMPGYGYRPGNTFVDTDFRKPLARDRAGLFLVDLHTGAQKTLVTMKELEAFEPDDSMTGAIHFVTHAVFSPDSTRVMFLHRWIHKSVYFRHSRLFSLELPGGRLTLLPPRDMVSHLAWRQSEEIVAYCRIEGADGYYLMRVDDGSWRRIARPLTTDGHPSIDRSGRLMVTDSYPDRRSRQRLWLYDLTSDELALLADVWHPPKFRTWSAYRDRACDLHPRIRGDGKVACFDAVYSGGRSLCTIDTSATLS